MTGGTFAILRRLVLDLGGGVGEEVIVTLPAKRRTGLGKELGVGGDMRLVAGGAIAGFGGGVFDLGGGVGHEVVVALPAQADAGFDEQ